jgi:hypothetical protein
MHAISAFDFSAGPGAGFGQDAFPSVVLGAPQGGGENAGSLDVLSLGFGGEVILQLPEVSIDKEGTDLLVFENPFRFNGRTFAEPAEISVSLDGDEWSSFPCVPDATPPNGCAGYEPVHINSENPLAVDNWDSAGGDAFDVSEISVDAFQYIRIRDQSNAVNDDQSAGFDLDAIATIYKMADTSFD